MYLNLGLFGFLIAGIFGSFSGLSFPYIYVAVIVAMTTMAEQKMTRPPGTAVRAGRRFR
jgi:hypothetical protein